MNYPLRLVRFFTRLATGMSRRQPVVVPAASVMQKLGHAKRAFEAMEASRTKPDKDEFEFYFAAFIGIVAALRQYGIRKRAESVGKARSWWNSFNKLFDKNIDMVTIVGLRNSDVHAAAVRTHHTEHGMKSYLAPSGVLEVKGQRLEVVEPPLQPGDPHRPKPTLGLLIDDYFIDPDKLPGDFMTDKKQVPQCKKGDVKKNLKTSSLRSDRASVPHKGRATTQGGPRQRLPLDLALREHARYSRRPVFFIGKRN
jgi:hypothetical protein